MIVMKSLDRFLTASLVAGAMLGGYLCTCLRLIHLGPKLPRTVAMPDWIPFWPVFVWPYLLLLAGGWLLPVAIRNGLEFRRCIRAAVFAYVFVAPWWVLDPTTLPRPHYESAWWTVPYAWLVGVDPPNNILPCAHVLLPTVGAWYAGLDRPRWRIPLIWLLTLCTPSIFLTWQHRPLDVALGLVAAAVGISLSSSERLFPNTGGREVASAAGPSATQ